MIAFAKPDNVIAMPQKSNEWYTPARYVEAARAVMGGIDLDPASCLRANQVVRATHYYTKEQNGLAQEWYGSIWLNPPYGKLPSPTNEGRSYIGLFVRKLVREYISGNIEQAVLLATPQTDSTWFQLLWEYTICFANHGVEFDCLFPNTARRNGKARHKFGTIFAYLGSNEQKFIDIFSQFGTIAKRVSTPRQTVTPLSLWNEVPS